MRNTTQKTNSTAAVVLFSARDRTARETLEWRGNPATQHAVSSHVGIVEVQVPASAADSQQQRVAADHNLVGIEMRAAAAGGQGGGRGHLVSYTTCDVATSLRYRQFCGLFSMLHASTWVSIFNLDSSTLVDKNYQRRLLNRYSDPQPHCDPPAAVSCYLASASPWGLRVQSFRHETIRHLMKIGKEPPPTIISYPVRITPGG